MNCDDIKDDLEAFALGVLEPAQARRIEAHLASCPDCAQVIRAYRIAIDHLALAVPLYRAPPRLKERVMGAIGALRPIAWPRILTSRWAVGAAATLLLAFAIGGVVWASVLSSQVDRLRADNAGLVELTQLDTGQRVALLRLQADLNSARTEQRRMSTTLEEQATLLIVALDPELIPSDLQGTNLAPAAKCSYVWSTKQSVGVLTCRELPSTAFSLVYELWASKGDKVVALGTFLPRVDGTAQLLVKFPSDAEGPATNLWVTLEQQGSARSKPSSEVVLQPLPAQQAAR